MNEHVSKVSLKQAKACTAHTSVPVQRVYFPWSTLSKHRYAINTVKKSSISKAMFSNTKASLMLGWQTK